MRIITEVSRVEVWVRTRLLKSAAGFLPWFNKLNCLIGCLSAELLKKSTQPPFSLYPIWAAWTELLKISSQPQTAPTQFWEWSWLTNNNNSWAIYFLLISLGQSHSVWGICHRSTFWGKMTPQVWPLTRCNCHLPPEVHSQVCQVLCSLAETCSEDSVQSFLRVPQAGWPIRVFMIPVLIPFRFHFGSGSRIFGSSILYDSICYCIGGWLAIADHPLSKFVPWLHSLHTTVKYSALMYEISKISTLWALISVIQIIFEFSVPNDSILL